jgi:hypothetical protein
MANTLKFGNGNWATKEDSVLAYNDENNNFKPLPFDFTRASIATYVDSDGLIKTSANNVPRVDYTDSTDGALLLEPARTNLFTYSELFSDSSWIKSQATATLTSEISPSGTTNNVYNYVGNSSNIYTTSQAINIEYTISCYAKSNGQGKDTFQLRLGNDRSGVFTATSEWKRYSFTSTPTTSVFSISSNALLDADILIWGAQLEAGSYATSYIPTSGSTVTRVAEFSSQTGVEQVIGQSEGTMYIEFIPLDASALSILFQIRTTGSSNVGQIDFRLQSGAIRTLGNDAGASQFNFSGGSYTVGTTYKVAVRYKTNDTKLYINGLFAGSDTTCSFSSSTKEQISFNEDTSILSALAKIKDARLYTTALTDAELATLTT